LVPHVEIGNATTFRDERHSKRPRYVVRQQPGGKPPAVSNGNDPPRRQTMDFKTALPGISGTASDQED